MPVPIKGRGTSQNFEGRFESRRVQTVDDGWWREVEESCVSTTVTAEVARSIIARNHSPVMRDVDLLADMSKRGLCQVFVSLTTLDDGLKRGLEPRAPSPGARLRAIQALSQAGVAVGVLAAPISRR